MESKTTTKHSPRQKKRISPHYRQELLAQRLLLHTLQQQQQCRKRPYLSSSMTQVTSSSITNAECDNETTPIDLHTAWHELSSLVPLLSYGDESKNVMLALMKIDPELVGMMDDDDTSESVFMCGLGEVLGDMLRIRRLGGRNAAVHESDDDDGNRVMKKQKITSQSSAVTGSNVNETMEVLPWNVILRMTIRFMALIAKLIQTKQNDDAVNSFVAAETTVGQTDSNTTKHPEIIASNNVKPNHVTFRESLSISQLNAMTYRDIRNECHLRGLSGKGTRSELIRRLVRYHDAPCHKGKNSNVKVKEEDTKTSAEHDTAKNDGTKQNNSGSNKTAFHTTSPKPTNNPTETGPKRVHPLLQSLDIVLSELNIILRTEQRRQLDDLKEQEEVAAITLSNENAGVSSSLFNKKRGASSMLKSHHLLPSPSVQKQSTPKMPMVNDRMIHDWKNRSWCGPSRYAFLKDTDYVIRHLDLESLDISVDEFREKVDTIVSYVDEYVGFEGKDCISSTPIRERLSGNPSAVKSSPTRSRSYFSPLSSPLRSSQMSSRSKLSGMSLAEITRVRINLAIEREKEVKEEVLSSSETEDPIMDPDLDTSHKPLAETDSNMDDNDDVGRLEDAYRMALAFSGSSAGSHNEGHCEVIQRQLELLARQLMEGSKDMKQDTNLAGIDSYLRLLLREVLQPSDPSVWVRLLNQSQGRETPMLLRRGRSALVSFLISIQVPGWDEEHDLDPSPMADYLGFLSARGATKGDDQQHAMLMRSSFLLPAVDDNVKSVTPPVVTQIGLGSCISNFVEKEIDSDRSGLDLVFSKRRKADPESLLQENLTLEMMAMPLPDVSELTQDLFDLTLRLAANDDEEHNNKPYPLRLATPSASESLKVVLDAVSDNRRWLEPRAVSKRYRLMIDMIIASFGEFGNNHVTNATACADIEADWGMRASSLIKIAKTVQNRARIAVYATHFLLILCGKQQSGQFSSSLYNLFDLQKFSQYWDDVASLDDSMSVISRVFNFEFCTNRLLSLSHYCSMSLARQFRFPSEADGNAISLTEDTESQLSLITILCSVFRLIHEDNLLFDCVHVGWAIKVLSLSIGSFTQCEATRFVQPLSMQKTPWHQLHDDLTKLYDDVWGGSRANLEKYHSYNSPKTISFTSIDKTMAELMPSFDALVTSLVSFARVSSVSGEINANWCNFVYSSLLRRYASVLPLNAVAMYWVRSLASTLQHQVLHHKMLEYSKSSSNFNDREDDADTERELGKLMNPLLKRLHCTVIMNHSLHMQPIAKSSTTDRNIIGFAFSELYKEGSSKILSKPSRRKTKRWHVYSACIGKIFISTPPSALFSSLGSSHLTELSPEALREVCDCFGGFHIEFIMAAAGFAVNQSLMMLKHSSDARTRIIYDTFTTQSKDCLMRYFAPTTSESSPDKLTREFHDFANNVGKYLHLHAADAGLVWFSELTGGISSLFESKSSIASVHGNDDPNRGRDIARVFSSLEESLLAISRST